MNLIREIGPDEVYNLAAQSHVKVSFEIPEWTGGSTGLGRSGCSKQSAPPASPPASPGLVVRDVRFRAAAADRAHAVLAPQPRWLRQGLRPVRIQQDPVQSREPCRGETFVTRKITRTVARIKTGLQDALYLGNRDGGYAAEYVEAMWLMLQQKKPDDFVIATGESHTVSEFCQVAFEHVGLEWERYVRVDPRYYRPTGVDHLCGDGSKASERMNWRPSTGFHGLVRLMVDADVGLLADELSGRLVRIDLP